MTAEASVVSGLAGRYAAALFDLARGQDAIDAVMTDLEAVETLIAESSDFARVIRSPLVSRREQGAAVAAVLEAAGVKGLAANFAGVAAANRRLFLLPEMIRQFRSLRSQHRGEVNAEVTSAVPLSDAQTSQVRERLAKATGRDVLLEAKVDSGLLGGLVVRVGSRMIDSSLRTKLANLKHVLKEVA